jgi:NAD+ kinase
MKVAIHGRSFSEVAKPFVQTMFDTLYDSSVSMQISDSFAVFLADFGVNTHTHLSYTCPDDLFDPDLIFTIGGDGTLLDAVTHVGARQTPILGINTGRLGFLATVWPKNIQEALQAVVNQQYEIEERTLISLRTEQALFENQNYALNDLVITKTDTSSMITIHAYLDNEFLNSYWADGLIISTPTGSTGYSLSCGGPVLLPQNQNFIVTPISPHNLNVRPMIIPDSSQLRLKIESRSNNFLVSLDSRFRIVEDTIELCAEKETFKARLVKMRQETFLDTLRVKLHWGLDARN